MEIHVKPLTPDLKMYVSIECISKNDESLLESKFVELQLVEPYGRKFQRWHGSSSTQPITYTIEHDATTSRRKSTINLSFTFTNNPVEVAWFLDALIEIENTDHVIITNLQTGQVNTQSSHGGFQSAKYDDTLYRLAKSLATIASHLNLIIPIPEIYTLADVNSAEIVAEILRTGKTPKITMLPKGVRSGEGTIILGGNVEQGFIDETKQEFERDGFAYIQLPGGWNVSIFGHEIELGKAEYWAYSPRILNEDEVDHYRDC